MLVFGTQMHLVTFIFVSIEVVIFFYLIIFRLARPDDETALLNIGLIFLLLAYNISGGLLPDPKLPGSQFTQIALAYATGFITPSYFPYYVYKTFNLKKMKFQAYRGAFIFLIIPYILFVVVYGLSGSLAVAKKLLILPVLYGLWLLVSLFVSLRYKYNNNFKSRESKQELAVLLFSIAPWVSLPVISVMELGQVVEASVTNFGFLLLFSLQVKRNIKQIRVDHEKLIESERKLRLLNDDLQGEVVKRTKELEEANQLKTRNFINLVHETKTPLTLVKNYLDEYIQKHGEDEELEIIKGGVDKLTADVINLFDVERFSKGFDVYKHNKVSDFSAILESSLPLFEYYCNKQNIRFEAEVEKNLFVKADPNAINRIVNNLIENAIKFTGAGGEIKVSLTVKEDKLFFFVQDNGPGIPPAYHKKVFEPYYQIGNQNTNLQGMGLGLPIVSKVVKSLGGEVHIESNPKEKPGTKVSVILTKHEQDLREHLADFVNEPAGSYFRMADIEVEDSVYSPARKTILLIEDNKAMLRFLSKKLKIKYNVYSSLNGADALKKLASLPVAPDLILSDIMMDKMDGFSFLKAFSDQEVYKHVPVILLTAKSTATDRLKGLRHGAIDIVSKPFSFEELAQKIETILANISKQQMAILNTSISNLNQMKNVSAESSSHFSQYDFDESYRLFNLTKREREIAGLMVEGKTYNEIAGKLYISEKTVTKHIQNIFRKTEVSNKIGLINRLMRN